MKSNALKLFRPLILLVVFALPLSLALAFPATYKDLVNLLLKYINYGIQFIIGLAFAIFAYKIYQTIFVEGALGGNANAYQKGRMVIVFGVVGMAAMISAWALIKIVKNSLFP